MRDAAPSAATLDANLRVLALRSTRAAEAVARAVARRDVTFARADDGALTGVVGLGNAQRRLASAFHPLKEAQRLAGCVDVIAAAAVVVRGFGVGHHVAALARRLGSNGCVVVFEPDAELLRAVFERVDCTQWLTSCPVAVVTGAEDTGELTGVLTGLEGVVTLGTKIIDHPPSRARLRESADVFGRTLAAVVAATRTSVATTIVQVEATLRNLLNNAGVYTRGAGIADLVGSRAGVPAVLVAAGPSLRKNIEVLRAPGVRERVVIIAVQTVLKQMLALGVKPHFVTALDYHEISARFYEGLTARDVEGVTLVVEPKCNPAIPRAFPGVVRCVGDDILDKVLGDGLARPMGSLTPGATVAHLSHALARHLGCDPVILVGQDLGFTDHQYYGEGAAIHRVWSAELSDFRTLEMMEWERIARMRGLLRRVSDQQGRPMHTDEQMATYQVLFERAFQKDAAGGLTVVDATEGGTLKQHTRVMPLRMALERYAGSGTIAAGGIAGAGSSDGTLPDPARVDERLKLLARSAANVRDGCKATILDLSEMLGTFEDQEKVNRLIERVVERGASLKKEPAYWVAQHLNQAGALNRFRADRAIALTPTLTPAEVQRAQIERDIRNVKFLGEAAQQASAMLEQARGVLAGQPPQTRDLPDASPERVEARDMPPRPRVLAVVHVDERWSALGAKRTRDEAVRGLAGVLGRLAQCTEIDGVVVAGDAAVQGLVDAALTRAAERPEHVLTHEVDMRAVRARRRCVAASRVWSRHCWRGAVGGLTVFDEVCCPAVDAPLAAGVGADALVLVGDDWVALDPALTDALAARHREAPGTHRFTFSQAPPGLCGCLIDAGLLREMSAARGGGCGGVRGTVGGLLAYLPDRSRMDPIAKAPCVGIPHCVRDCLWRCTLDDVNFRAAWSRVRGDAASGEALARAFAGFEAASDVGVPRVPECATIHAHCPEGGVAGAVARVRDLAESQPLLGVTIVDADGSGEWRALADGARASGASGLHLRTSHEHLLRFGVESLIDAMDFGVDVVSVELPADSRALWEARSGADTRDRVWGMLQEFLDERGKRTGGGLPRTWLVPRITRCDATLDEVQGFYDRWISACGACVIDPPPPERRGWETLRPLPVPAHVLERRAWSHVEVEVESREGAALTEGAAV